MGLSDRQIGDLVKTDEMTVRRERKALGIIPAIKQIDTLAAEFPAKTNYLYCTYHDTRNDIPKEKGSYVILGSGTYRIGSSVEFDYCAVSTARALRKMGKTAVMINYNPETVSTDYDESDKLYFEELTLERVLDIIDQENPEKVIVSVGGQEAQNLSLPLFKQQVPIAGTSPEMIDRAEDRYKFSQMCDSIHVHQPEWKELTTKEDSENFADRVGYPVLIRPSYVLSGAAMKVAWSHEELKTYLDAAVEVSPDYPVVVTKFIEGAKEIELDAVANKGELVNWAVSEHIENAGVHSGDATMVLPSFTLTETERETVKEIGGKIAQALQISGPMNIQFIFKDGKFLVIECNLRASRSFPFVSKTYDIDFIATATKIFLGQDVEPNPNCDKTVRHYCVKAPQFSFIRIHGSDPILGVEMASTGEVAAFGKTVHEAFLKAYLSVHNGFRMPKQKKVLISGDVPAKFSESVNKLVQMGFTIYTTKKVSSKLRADNKQLKVTIVEENEAVDLVMQKKVDFVVNIPKQGDNTTPNYYIRRRSVEFNTPLITNLEVAEFMVLSLENAPKLHIEPYSHYIKDEL
jgi:carbamoyl-phosphate synthase large subunit